MKNILKIIIKLYYLITICMIIEAKYDEYEFMLENCCNLGTTRAKQLPSADCSNNENSQSDRFATNSQFKLQCQLVMQICCIKEHESRNCEYGKTLDNCENIDYQIVTNVSGESAKECCLSCQLGSMAAKENFPCTFNPHGTFGLGNPWEETYYQCCTKAKNNVEPNLLKRKAATVSLCDSGASPCAHKCYDPGAEFGSVQCTCFKGYQLANDGHNCIDINECEDGTHNCDIHYEKCLNSDGGFKCLANPNTFNDDKPMPCPNGYKWSSQKKKCEDIDECRQRTDNCSRIHQLCKNLLGSFTCLPRGSSCPPGFKQSNNKTTDCTDVDECAENLFDCQTPEEQCVNSYGGYYCEPNTQFDSTTMTTPIYLRSVVKCANGFRLSKITQLCEDINECMIGQHSCNLATHRCHNTNGSYSCVSVHHHQQPQQQNPQDLCSAGLRRNRWSNECEDINECEVNDRPCPSGQTCRNTIGSYICYCQVGYMKDINTGVCKDLNECQLGTHTCHHDLRCDNTIGSFHCVRVQDCGTGYTINAETDTCEDVDECELRTHNCGNDYRCRNIGGSFRCDRIKCPNGLQLMYDGTCKPISECGSGRVYNETIKRCLDIDECANSPCRTNERCVNTLGSYTCTSTCSPGYQLSRYGTTCEDIDECTAGTHECNGIQICRNRPGNYICECPVGYSLNQQRVCEDIDECAKYGSSVCSPDTSICKNTIGSYQCTCKTGFKDDGSGRFCRDINECNEIANLCSHKCFNTWGSYQCTCDDGYKLDEQKRNCIDIDECQQWLSQEKSKDYYRCIGNCRNTPGSYECTCPRGYRIGTDKRTCNDINECEESGLCNGDNEICLNTRGNYKCNRVECPPGYYRDYSHKSRCKKQISPACNRQPSCVAQELKEPLSYSYNYLTFISNYTIPPSGYLDLFTMRGPVLSITTVQFELQFISSNARDGVKPAVRDDFHLRRTSYNEAMVSLVRTLQGPQDIKLELEVKLYHNGSFGGSSKAILYVYVSEYEF